MIDVAMSVEGDKAWFQKRLPDSTDRIAVRLSDFLLAWAMPTGWMGIQRGLPADVMVVRRLDGSRIVGDIRISRPMSPAKERPKGQ